MPIQPLRTTTAVSFALALALSASAGDRHASVITIRAEVDPAASTGGGSGAAVIRLDAGQRDALRESNGVRLEAFPLPGRPHADLVLERFRVTAPGARFVVAQDEGRRQVPLDYDPERVVLLRGHIAGAPDSRVFLALSDSGDNGYIETGPGGEQFAIASRGVDGRPLAPGSIGVYRPRAGGRSLPPGVPNCGVATSAELWFGDEISLGAGEERPAGGFREPAPHGLWFGGDVERPMDPAGLAPARYRRQLQLAIETDNEYYVLFNDLTAAGDYVVQLYGAVSDIYMRDLNTQVVLTFVRLWDDPNDLFNQPDPLSNFRDYWNNNMGFVVRDAAQFLSGRRNLPAGGVAYLNGLCNSNAYSWSGYTLGFFYDPTVPSPWNRDVMTTAHEVGHNCGTAHTHDYGLDTCQDETSQPQRGTIMSYCGQTFTGGDGNMDMRFDTYTADLCIHYIATRNCILHDCNGNGVADLIDIAQGTSQDLDGNGRPDECEDCDGNGIPDSLDIAAGAPDLDGNGILDFCETDCNGNGIPDGGDLKRTFTNVAFADNFDDDLGWTVQNMGATAGDWERGIPVDDPNTTADPPWASGGYGWCYLTGNYYGNSDVDNGATRLISPIIDMSAGGLYVAYDYYMTAGDPNNDRLLVEGSNNGPAGPWRQLNVHTGSTGNRWRSITLTPAQLSAAGLQQTANMQFRFTINDSGQQGTVEGAVDEFVIGVPVAPYSADLNRNGFPDECEVDCDGDGVSDYNQINADMSLDLNRNTLLDDCEDCDGDGVPDLVALDHSHNAWVADLELGHLRQYLAVAGTFTRGSDDAGLDRPNDVIVTRDRRVLVSSGGDNRIVEFTVDGTLVGDLVPGGAGGLAHPAAMLLRPGGTLLVASRDTNSVLEYDLGTGAFVGAFVPAGAAGLIKPFGLTFGPNGNLFVTSDNNQVFEFDGQTGAFVRIFVSILGNGGLSEPRGVLFLPAGNLLVASHGTDAILEYHGQTGAFVRQFSQIGNGVVLTFDQPWCLRLGPDGGVYASRSHDHELGPGGPGGKGGAGNGGAPLHLSNARIYHFDPSNGYFVRCYVMGVNSGLHHPSGFDFIPDAGADCNNNQVPDNCDIASGFSLDGNNDGIPDECQCPGDLNGDGLIGQADLGILLANYGCDQGPGQCPGDIDNDGQTGQADLGILLARYGQSCD